MELEEKISFQHGYDYFEQIRNCYNSLIDDLSRDVFWARLQIDMQFEKFRNYEPCPLAQKVFSSSKSGGNIDALALNALQSPVYIYGIGRMGVCIYKRLLEKGIEVKGFLDKKYNTESVCCGLPVLAPDTPVEGTIVIASTTYDEEIRQYFQSLSYSVKLYPPLVHCDNEHQYFDFMEFYCSGAFVDAGCFNCGTTINFIKRCKGNYSKIFAFEPNDKNYQRCIQIVQQQRLRDVQMIQAGLGRQEDTARFESFDNGSSHVSEEGSQTIRIVALDDIVGDEKISFIKMDIEGAELDALMGAANVIQRDKPLCAICVYHKQGDMFVISDYLKKLVPEYRFALRHYSSTWNETVLYAFI